ncbi:MAG: helix-turn-helix domain-containing protein [Desulfovibrio sp.]
MTSKIGERVKSFREKLNITQQDLAERAGLELSFIVAVEEDNKYPSLGPLLKIARALGVRMGTFLDDETSRDPLIVKLDEREEELTMHKGDVTQATQRYFSLGKGKTDRHMEPFFIEMLPEPEETRTLSSHEGEEFIVVVSGEICLEYGKDKQILKKGDSMYYNSIVPHTVYCNGDTPAEIYAVLYFPE